MTERVRCAWVGSDPLMTAYHDTEWGVPLHDDRRLFEFLVLDAFQAGLSWSIVLRKRENFRLAFDDFDALKIARYSPARIERLMNDAGIVRNRSKIVGTVKNAQSYLATVAEFGSFDKYIWQFTGGRPRRNAWTQEPQRPAKTEESDAMSADLRERGFTFVGSTICYAFMQAAGMVNDHLTQCFRYRMVTQKRLRVL